MPLILRENSSFSFNIPEPTIRPRTQIFNWRAKKTIIITANVNVKHQSKPPDAVSEDSSLFFSSSESPLRTLSRLSVDALHGSYQYRRKYRNVFFYFLNENFETENAVLTPRCLCTIENWWFLHNFHPSVSAYLRPRSWCTFVHRSLLLHNTHNYLNRSWFSCLPLSW